jgi:hypothetical protein
MQIYHVGYPCSHLNTEVKQHWAWIMLGWDTFKGISGSAGTLPCGLCTVLPDSLCLNQLIEACLNKKRNSNCIVAGDKGISKTNLKL